MKDSAPGELFDEQYYAVGCGAKYERNEEWLAFFGGIAERIIADIHPRTVMDAGCALGLLVESLRTRGVAAFGRDISQFAIEHVHPSIYPYCELGSITDHFPQRYDLIVSIEVLEHMPPQEARQAIANLCQHTDDILFSSTSFDYKEATHFNVQPPEYWAELFAQQGFYRDVDYDAGFITEWAVRFRRSAEPPHRIVREYERAYCLLRKETRDLRAMVLQLRSAADAAGHNTVSGMLSATEQSVTDLALALQRATHELVEQDRELQDLRARSDEQQLALQHWQDQFALLASALRHPFLRVIERFRGRIVEIGDPRRVPARTGAQAPSPTSEPQLPDRTALSEDTSPAPLVAHAIPLLPVIGVHPDTIDIVICVHDALADVKRCVDSVAECTAQPYHLILVDDGSGSATQAFLDSLALSQGATLIRNPEARGYTCAANQGLQAGSALYAVMLNSDTTVSPGWLDRMVACAGSDPSIGLVGPLSNAATWQSVPEIIAEDAWATNPLPPFMSVAEMAEGIARYSARLYPRVPLLNGFCLLIRRQLLDEVGYFDEDRFGAGYGEENDYCLRATDAGWALAIADDTYVYHAGSKSYSEERRRELCDRANLTLKQKHGEARVNEAVDFLATSRVLQGIRAHSAVIPQQEALIRQAKDRFGGRKLLWVLPVCTSGGGGAVVASKAQIMRQMGISVAIFNLCEYQQAFEEIYPGLEVPVLYGRPEDVGAMGGEFDAVVATANVSAYWLLPLVTQAPQTTLGYFIQDFEPYFYNRDSADYKLAWGSYSIIPSMHRFATTQWIQNEVIRNTGMTCGLVGPCYNSALFRPRPRSMPEWPHRPLYVGAMIRPATPHRAPRLTMEVLAAIDQKFGPQVEIRLFGCNALDPAFLALPHDFRWRHAGPLNQPQVAAFLNELDIFVDFSTFQALGITAQEAMSCGAAVIVPRSGGTGAFARHGHNCLVVDSHSAEDCARALTLLIEDQALRTRLQRNGTSDVCAHHPHLPTYNILDILFGRC